jgi:hypothetical protein
MLARCDLGILAAGAFSRGFAAPIDSTVRGVLIGAQSHSFRDVHHHAWADVAAVGRIGPVTEVPKCYDCMKRALASSQLE